VGLSERIKLANDRAADLFVSVHANSMPTSRARERAVGAETYFLSAEATDEAAALVARLENADEETLQRPRAQDPLGVILADLARSEAHADSSRLAYTLQSRLVSQTGARDRGVRQAPFFVLEGAVMPAVLVEVGYISHPVEGKRLASADGQAAIARALADGIEDFRRDVLDRRGKAEGDAGAGSVTPGGSKVIPPSVLR
jgi:N-acetylmuramoyl-L-alanine amidase